MTQNKAITKIIEKAKAGGYKFVDVVDEFDTTKWESAWLPGGAFVLFKMSEDRREAEKQLFYSLFDFSLAHAVFGEEYIKNLTAILNYPNEKNFLPGEEFNYNITPLYLKDLWKL